MSHATLANSSARSLGKETATAVESTRKTGTDSLTEDRWAEFVRNDWEKNATVLKAALSAPLVSDQSMFAALLQVSRAYRNGHGKNKLSFWIDGRKIQELADYLPVASDKSVPGYIRRLDRQLRGSEFTLLVADPHIYDYNLWNVARRFLRGLYAQVGMPCGGVDTTFFIGRYKRTPFGVHRGQMSVMTFPVHAEKRFRTWPRGYGEAHPEIESLLDYPDHEQASSELIGSSKDVLYWPADIWHIAEGSEQFTSTFNIGFWWDRPPLTRVLFEMSRRLAEKLNTSDFRGFTLPDKFSNGHPLAAQMDSSINEAIGLTRNVLADEDFDTSLALNSMRTISADAFRDVPPLRPMRECSSSSTDLLCADPHSRFLFGHHNETLYIAANGNLFSVQPHLETLLRDLLSGKPMLQGHAVNLGGGEFVRWLERVRVLRTMNTAESAD
jgi:hypothetical protein